VVPDLSQVIPRPDRFLHAAVVIAVMALPFIQTYCRYRERRATTGAYAELFLLGLYVVIAVVGAMWNVLGAFGLVRV
jgi:hypothetical protein